MKKFCLLETYAKAFDPQQFLKEIVTRSTNAGKEDRKRRGKGAGDKGK